MTKCIIFDAGPLINFAMNGILPILKDLKKEFNGKFIITNSVKKEIIDRPEKIKRFELEALKLNELFIDKIIELPVLTKEQQKQIERKTNEFMNLANSTFKAKGKNLHLIDKGEAEVLALATLMDKECVIAVDERTTRILCENPENLKKLLEKKLHTKIQAKKENYQFFENFKIIRSTELIYMANKKKLITIKDPRAYEAMLYAVKFKGTSISENEIEQMKRI
jgi:predicted nucleic acid-binding protein